MNTNIAETYFFDAPNGARYCLDVNSSAVFAVDEIAESVISLLPTLDTEEEILTQLSGRYAANDLAETMSQISEMRTNGFLGCNEKARTLQQMPERYAVDLLGLSLMVASICNLNCVYCFNDGGAADKALSSFMTLDIAKKAVDFLLERSSGPVGLDFFGGEPLLAFGLIREVVAYALSSGRECQFSMITNGTQMSDEIIQFLSENSFHIVVSYDGYLQPVLRQSRDGVDTRDSIRATVKSLVERLPRQDISIRSILTHRTTDFKHLTDEALELGVRLVPGLITVDPGHPLDLREDDFQRLKSFEEGFLLAALESEDIEMLTGATNIVNTVLRAADCSQRHYSCGVGKDILAVSIDGDIYPCHRFIGLDEFKMGTIFDGIDDGAFRRYADLYVDGRESCSTCWARYFCGGGCAHESYTYCGRTGESVPLRCDLIRHETELGLKLYAVLADRSPNVIAAIRASYAKPMSVENGGR